MTGTRSSINRTQLASLAVLFIATTLLWNTQIVYPVRMLVVFFHELCHVLAAVVTGGSGLEINLDPREGGLAQTMGGSRFLILSAGYLGSLVVGGVILVLASRTNRDRQISQILGVLLVGVGLWLVRPVGSFGFVYCLLTGAALFGIGRFLGGTVNDLLAKFIGLTSCLYVILDIKSDIIDRAVQSDATMLADYTGIPRLVWGGLWILIALAATIYFLRIACAGSVARGDGS